MIERVKIVLVAACVFLVMSGCSLKEYKLFQDDSIDEDKVTVVDDQQYHDEMVFENKIVPNDRITVEVFNQSGSGAGQLTSMVGGDSNQDSNNGGLLVTQRGTIFLPLIGEQIISGLTENEAANFLTEKYKKYLRNPYVTVQIENQRIFILGEVKSPGVIQVTNGTMNLIEAIARSGDMSDYANRQAIKILRGDLRKPDVRIVDLTQMSAIRISSLFLQPNDIVYVQPRTIKGYNLAYQQVAPSFGILSSLLQPFVQITFLYEALEN